MSKGALRELEDTIRGDRDEVRSGLLGTLPTGGKVERDRLRWIAEADRIELSRGEGARNAAEYISAVSISRSGRRGAGSRRPTRSNIFLVSRPPWRQVRCLSTRSSS